MKARTFIAVSILIMLAFVLIGSSSTKEITIDEAMEALCGTWVNTEITDRYSQKDIYHSDGTYSWYREVTDTNPYKGTFTIEEAWTDREGTIWIKAKLSFHGKPYAIYKISDSGTVLESKWFLNEWPEDIKSIRFYLIYYRQ